MKSSSAPWALQHSAASDSLKRFIAEKVAHATAMAQANGKQMWPQFKSMFAAAERGDVLEMRRLFEEIRKPLPPGEPRPTEYCSHGSQWSVALELYGALEQFDGCGEKYAVVFGQDVIASIPPGSIYLGGTDPGRFVITALCESHVRAVPFFTLTQNSLADRGYRQYLRGIYGDRMIIPREEDWTKVYAEYLEDAQRRRKENQLLPGEFLEDVDGKLEVRSSHVGVMVLNGLLSKLLFDRNPDREFFVEESFPMDWMFPHLVPHDLILRINRQPLAELSDEAIQRDHDCWTRYIQPMIGDWLTRDTPVAEVAAFIKRVHWQHDLTGFEGDARFVQNDAPQRLFSKLRSSIAGVYAWRVSNGKGSGGSDQMMRAADFAFRQAWALCPRSPEAVFRYINLLATHRRFDDACLLAETAARLDPDNPQLQYLLAELTRMKAAPTA
jgi:hypothetical protein